MLPLPPHQPIAPQRQFDRARLALYSEESNHARMNTHTKYAVDRVCRSPRKRGGWQSKGLPELHVNSNKGQQKARDTYDSLSNSKPVMNQSRPGNYPGPQVRQFIDENYRRRSETHESILERKLNGAVQAHRRR